MKAHIDLMTGHPSAHSDQLPVAARNESQRFFAGVLALSALVLGATISPGVVAPRAESVTLSQLGSIPEQRQRQGPDVRRFRTSGWNR